MLESFSGELPAELQGVPLTAGSWLAWETKRDQEIRARLKRGDADSIFNLVLFGTSFTAQPRVTGGEEMGRVILARVHDMAQAVRHPAGNERLQLVVEWLQANGVDPAGPDAGKRVEAVLLENALRVRREQRAYAETIADAKQKGDAADLFVTRSSLYRDRGLSLDTSFRPNFAIERSLAEMKAAGVLREVRRAAVIGPGLDFADKRSGYDFYPMQTLQPFALIDSLRKLRLAGPAGPAVEIFDLSDRVLSHVRRAVARARAGAAYTVQVPLDGDTRWLPETIDYWRSFGAEIGAEAKASHPPAGVEARMHAVRIRPGVVALSRRRRSGRGHRTRWCCRSSSGSTLWSPRMCWFITARSNRGWRCGISRTCCGVGGVLLSNNALPDVDDVPMRAAGSSSVAYAEDPDDGDRVVWYKRGSGA